MARRHEPGPLPVALARPGHVTGDGRDRGTAAPGPAARLGNRAVARMLTEGNARPEAAAGLRQLGNGAVARLLAGSEVRRDAAADAGGGTLTRDVAGHIDAQRGGGTALPDDLRVPMQRHLGADLGGVRVHTGEAAATLARSLGAEAFTTGQDMFFGAGRYAPGSAAGRELIAHEAVHVAQQSPGRIGFSRRVSDPSDAAEVEARALAPAVARSVESADTAPETAGPAATPAAGRDVHRAPTPGAPAADLGTVLSVPAMEALRRDATAVTLLAGAYAERGVQAVDALKTNVVGASDTYTRAYETYARVIRAAGAEARNQQDWINIFVGIGIGVGVGMLSAAIVPEGLALGWAVLAEAAGETVEAAAAAGVQASGITTVAGTDLQPGGLDPHVLSTGVWHNLADLYRGVLGVQRHTRYLPLILGGAEYALGQFRLMEAGAPTDMERADLVGMAVALNRAGAQVRLLGPELTRRLAALDRLREQAAAVTRRELREVEHDVWIMWMETVPDGQSDLLDLDEIEDHLEAIGMLGSGGLLGVDFGMWTSTDDEREALAAARARAREVRNRYNALQGQA
ncbi:DUF4157 domain-containing protein [Actinoplanes sp. NPDC049118]|uniref:eCIS core domain-containing protein n=1 Tax=Actinoplanes sp. NPDC049118 TaxID=3155769 RepID=UPI0033ED4C80